MKIIIVCFTIFRIGVASSSMCDLFNNDISKTTLTIFNKNFPIGVPLSTGTIIQDTDMFVLAHEWLYDSTVEWLVETRPNLQKQYPDANIIVIDYGLYSHNSLYIPDVCTSPYVGQLAADKLISLDVNASLISCTGHSMGAEVCGAFGRRFVEKNKGQIARITGIDAAGPGYDDKNYLFLMPIMKHISKDDAKQVVGIYTDSSGWGSGMNKKTDYSHISIIINDGNTQPGCKNVFLCPVISIITLGADDFLDCFFCAHRFSREVYKRAISGQIYELTKCLSYSDYTAGICKGNISFVYKDKLEPSVTDGVYYVKIDSTYNQIT